MSNLARTPEYAAFLQAFARLGQAHERDVASEDKCGDDAFLQHYASNDVVCKIFEYSDSKDLVVASATCHRFRKLAKETAMQKTAAFRDARSLGCEMKTLRAQEQVQGIGIGQDVFSVQVPVLGLKGRVLVSDCGDDAYNGLYFCTDVENNGWVFKKPANNETDFDCVISKRFSEQRLLWYMSKSIRVESAISTLRELSFWCPLVTTEEIERMSMPVDRSYYPNTTSLLTRNGDPGWIPVEGNILNSPTVELDL